VGDRHEVVGQHGCTDEHLEALESFGETALHSTASKEHRDTALDTGAETLSLLEGRVFLESFSLRCLFSAALRNTDELDAANLTQSDVVLAEKPPIGAVEVGSKAEGFFVTLQRPLDVILIGGVALQNTVLRNQPPRAFSEKDLMAKLDRFLYFPPLDQIGVDLEDRIDFLLGWNLLSLEHATASLVDDAVAKLGVVIDRSAQLADDNVVHRVQSAWVLDIFEYPSGVLYDLLGNPNQIAILSLLPVVALSRCHPFDLLHPAPCRACAVGKANHSLGNNFAETTDEPGDDAHDIPEQSAIGWIMDVGLANRRIHAQFLAVLDSQLHGRLDDQIIDGLKGGGLKLDKSPIESVVHRDALAVETSELAQGVPVGNPLAQFAIIPVLNPHQDQGAQHLRRSYSATPHVGFFHTPLEIFSDQLDDLWMIVQEVGNPLKNRVEINPLGEELQIGEANLRVTLSCHG